MKTKKRISKLFATSIIAVASVASSYGQSNLGSACGCPAVASRPSVLLSALPGFTAVAGTFGGELTSGAVLTCANNYIIDQKIYIPAGQTLTINPGTVLKGRIAPNDIATGLPDKAKASALVIERGGKIMAEGSADCQIVFTAEADNLNGLFPIANMGQWGGVVILGKATNNLTLAANGPFVAGGAGKLAVGDGLGTIEGFATTNPQDRYGVLTAASLPAGVTGELTSQVFDDNDNSGVMKYVSIRYSGAILAVGAEINGLTLGSVGRGTTIEHIEIVSCADDNIEIFGGTVNLKYITTLFGNDDMFDWDLGWTGKAQFLFGMKTDNTASVDSDSGFESDSDDNKSIGLLNTGLRRSTPVIYNATILGNNKSVTTSDNGSIAAINAKELTGGEIYNSVFANFKNGLNLTKSMGTRTGTSEAYHNWSSTLGNGTQILKVKCNTFVGCTNPLTVGNAAASTVAADNTQFTTTDLNVIVAGNTLPGFDYSFAVDNTTNVFSAKNDPIPNPALTVVGCPVAPADGFFRVANYRGAFASTGDNWLSDWSYSQVLGATKGLVACPTDLDSDGDTDVDDFQIFAPAFGTNCN